MTPDPYDGIERNGTAGLALARVVLPDGAEPEWWSLRTPADAETLLRYYADRGVERIVWSLYRQTQPPRPEATTRPEGAHTIADEQAPLGSRVDPEARELIEWAIANGHGYQVGGGENQGRHRCGCGVEVRHRTGWLRHVRAVRSGVNG